MVKNNERWKTAIASVVVLALWTLICFNTSLFERDGKFLTGEYIICYAMTLGTWAICSFKYNFSKIFSKVLAVLVFLIIPFACMQISMIFFPEIEYALSTYMLNVLVYAGLLAVLFAITQSTGWASVLMIICAYIFNIAAYLVGFFRGTPLIPSDLLAIGTAIGVAEQYTFKLDFRIIWATVTAVFFIVLGFKFPLKLKFRFKHIVYPVVGVVLALAVFVPMGAYDISQLDLDLFDQEKTNKTYGVTYAFYVNMRRMSLDKPEGYNSGEMRKILESVPKNHPQDTPNIIVIMNESLSELQVVGEFSTNTPYMPYIDSMKKDTIKGNMIVSPFGGYTCNSEFEFLTGASMGLLPRGSAPYLQYITNPMPYSVSAYLKELGYTTVAWHPYYARGWNREKVYGLFGFDKFISLENIEECVNENEIRYIRNYISDETSYRGIKNLFESKADDEKLFVFNITMQNHGGYWEDSDTTIHIRGLDGYYPGTEQYLTLLKHSDTAFKNLINYFSKVDEDTVILMFGDHLPAIEQEFYEELKGKPLWQWSYEESLSRYTVPFLIWANYDIEEKDDVLTSTNYLQNLLYDAAGIPKNGLNVFLEEQQKKIPAINGLGHLDSDMNWVLNENDSEILNDYAKMEYYLLTE